MICLANELDVELSGGGGIGGGINEAEFDEEGENICWLEEKSWGGVGGGNVGGWDSLGLVLDVKSWLFGDFFIWSVNEDISASSLVNVKDVSFDWTSCVDAWSKAK